MGLLPSRPSPPDPNVPTPVSSERLVELFRKAELYHFIDSDGDLGGRWDDATYYFTFQGANGEVMVVRGQYPGRVNARHLETVREVLDASLRSRPWPNASFRIDDDGTLRVLTDHAVDYEHGATDAQLMQHVACATAMASRLFERLDQALGR